MVATLGRPITGDLNRRLFLGGTAAALALAGCGTSQQATGRTESAPGYPRQVDGRFGPTVVPNPPKRIVALGIGPDAATVLALGALPVAMARDTTVPGGILPWVGDALGGREVELLDSVNQVPFEKIAALRPDLIVATTQYTLPQDHDRLARIAPVLSYATAPNTDRWQDTTVRLGRLLGADHLAAHRVNELTDRIAGVKADHPAFAGRTFTFGPVTGDGSVFTISAMDDLSAAFLQQLGLVMSPKVRGLPPSVTKGKSRVGMELLDVLDADVLMLTYTTPDAEVRRRLEANPLFQKVPAVRRGAYVPLDLPTALAIAFPSVLSLGYGLDHTVSQLAAVLK
jgi:iron complex transport system substrate-binding protein